MHRVFASTGAFIGRPNGRDFRLLRELAPQVKCDGFELMFYDTWYGRERELIDFLGALGLSFPTYHCEKHIGELLAEERFSEAYERFEVNCSVAKDIGAKLMVIHLWNGPISDSNIGANFSAYPELQKIAAKYGITPTAENVISNGRSPLTLWHILRETSPDALFTYDTKMAQFDFENEVAFSPENIVFWDNVRHLHINDRVGGYRDWSSYRALNIGQGDVDFGAFFDGLKRVGYKGDFTVEANAFLPDGTIDLKALNESIEKVRVLAEGLK